MLTPIHIIDFEGNRTYGIKEYGLVTLEDNAIRDVHHAHCAYLTPLEKVQNAEYFRSIRESISPEETAFTKAFGETNQPQTFTEYLALFQAKRACGFFCAHHATVEDRLLRRYHLYPQMSTGHHQSMCHHESVECSDAFSEKTLTQRKIQSMATLPKTHLLLSWGPWIDTFRLYKRYYPMAGRYTVAELIRHFRFEKKLEALVKKYALDEKVTFHCALHDALATTLLLQNFIHLFQVKDIRFLLYH